MSRLDYLVLFGTLLTITLIGVWKTRSGGSLSHYLKGDEHTRWGTIGLSVLATQASAITFLSAPGQAYENGVGFVQNYFGQPLALIVVCVLFIPAFQRLKVFTAYEYLGQRFDQKTRLLGASLFLIQRGLATGITIYAPAIIISALARLGPQPDDPARGRVGHPLHRDGWRARGEHHADLPARRDLRGHVRGARGGDRQAARRTFPSAQAVAVAGKMGKLAAVDLSFSPERRYTLWSGIAGRVLPRALLLRGRPDPGAALPRGRVGHGQPLRIAVQRRRENPDAVFHPVHRHDGVSCSTSSSSRRLPSTAPPTWRRWTTRSSTALQRDVRHRFRARGKRASGICSRALRAGEPNAERAAKGEALARRRGGAGNPRRRQAAADPAGGKERIEGLGFHLPHVRAGPPAARFGRVCSWR